MKLIKRLEHTQTSMEGAIFGWDIFRSADYSAIDNTADRISAEKARSLLIKGHTIIIALNIGKLRLFKRLFIRI